MIIGLVVAVMPFLGFPSSWDATIYIILGLLIIAIAYRLVPAVKTDEKDRSMPFTDNKGSHTKTDVVAQSKPLSDVQESITNDHAL